MVVCVGCSVLEYLVMWLLKIFRWKHCSGRTPWTLSDFSSVSFYSKGLYHSDRLQRGDLLWDPEVTTVRVDGKPVHWFVETVKISSRLVEFRWKVGSESTLSLN